MHPSNPFPEQQNAGGVPPKPSWDPPPAPPQRVSQQMPQPVQQPVPQYFPQPTTMPPAAPPPYAPGTPMPPGAPPVAGANRDSLLAGAWGAVAALVTAFIASGVLAAVVSSATHGRSDDAFPVARVGAWLFGLAFGAPLSVTAGGSAARYGSGSLGADIHLPVPFILLVAGLVTAALTVRSQRARPVVEPARALAAAACAAVVPAVLGLVSALASTASSGSSAAEIFSGNAELGLSVLAATALPGVILFAVSALARFGAGGVRVAPGLVQAGLGPSLRAVGDYLLLTVALASVVGLAVALATTSNVGAVLGGWLLFLPGLGVLGAQLSAFAPLEVSGSSHGSLSGMGSLLSSAGLSGGSGSSGRSQSVTLFGGDAPGWTWALVLIPVVGVVVAGVRYTLRRPASTTPPLSGAVLSGLLMAAAIFVLDRYLSLGASATGQASNSAFGGASGSGSGGIGIGALGYLSALVVGALIPLVGWAITPALYRSAPGALRATAGLPARSRSVLAVLPARSGATGAFVLGLVLLLLAGGGGVAAGRSLVDDGSSGQDTASADLPQEDYLPPTEAPPSFTEDPSTETPSYTPDPTPTETAPALPTVSPGGIDLSAVADDPVVGDVAGTLDSYFGAINRHDGFAAVSNFDPAGAMNPNDSSQVAKFQHDTSTSADQDVVIHAIAPDPETVGGYLVSVSFRSTQAPSFGPGGNEACTLWDLSYHMTPQFKLLRSSGASHSAC